MSPASLPSRLPPWCELIPSCRFVAAAMVVAHHARGFQIPMPHWALDHGVSFFFVLSGFILSHRYPKLETASAISHFYLLRIARIWPAHVTTLLLAMALLQLPIKPSLIPNALLLQSWIP
jgi:peptidoglycan/LPS O-acetylase OafA/YrhL